MLSARYKIVHNVICANKSDKIGVSERLVVMDVHGGFN